jgi:mRNA interferase HigB
MFNIITRRTINDYSAKYPNAKNALFEWYYEMIKQEFESFQDLKAVYGNASIVSDNRVVFNIMGNKYRLVVRIVFKFKSVQVKWFGTHAEYDKIDVSTVQYSK